MSASPPAPHPLSAVSLEDEYNRLLGEDIMKSRTLQQNMLELNQLRLNVKFLRASNKEYENGRITALAEKHMVDMERTRLQVHSSFAFVLLSYRTYRSS